MSTRRPGAAAAVIAAVLAAAVLPFLPVLRNGFTNWDDPLYVTANPAVRGGFGLAGMRWAWTSFHAANWHPLTWMSHQLDWTLFGADPSGHHAVSLLLHALNALLVFRVLARATGESWTGGAAAVLWAVHPLRVESVAWVAERKDVLSTALGLAAILAYMRWRDRPTRARFLAVAGWLAAGLCAKPMLVTIPAVLLLFDIWPLERGNETPLSRRIVEKLPLTPLVAASAAITVAAQRATAMSDLVAYPLGERLANAVVAAAAYVAKTVWPAGLSPFYPHPGPTLHAGQVAAAGALLAAITLASLLLRRRAPYLLFGWGWYLVTLVPVIGIVQVGSQGMADRYTYVPTIGLTVAIAWGVRDLMGRSLPAAPLVAIVAAVALAPVTWAQCGYWKDSVSLYSRVLSLHPDAALAHNNLGMALAESGSRDEALEHFRQAWRLAPSFSDAAGNLGLLLADRDDPGAVAPLRAFLDARPGEPLALAALLRIASVLLRDGRVAEAVPALEALARQRPEAGAVHANLATAYARLGRTDDARKAAERAIALGSPPSPDVLAAIGMSAGAAR